MQIIRATKTGAPAKKPVAAKAAPSKAAPVKANTVAAPKVMAKYNRSLDLVALAMSLGAKGKTVQAAKVFMSAINHSTCASAINVINASNAVALQAAKLQAAKMKAAEEGDNELSDEELDQLLGDDHGVSAEFGEDGEGEDGGDEAGDGTEGEGEDDAMDGDEAEMAEDDEAGDGGTDLMAKVLARLTKQK